jgi:hypothetical protein
LKYKKYPLPIEAWKNLKLKQRDMGRTFKELTGKERVIPLSQIILALSRRPIFLDNNEIVKMARKNK